MERKRMMSVLFCICFIFCLGGCGSKNKAENAKEEDTEQTVAVRNEDDAEEIKEKEEPVKREKTADTQDTDKNVQPEKKAEAKEDKKQEEKKQKEEEPVGQKKSQEKKKDTKVTDTPKTDVPKADNPKTENTKESSKENKSQGKTEAEVKEEHVHQWTDKTQVRHHDAVTEQTWVEDVPAWDEEIPVYEEREQAVCVTCGAEIQGNPNEHLNDVCRQWKNVIKKVQEGTQTVHHDAEGHYETRTVKEAYDEVIVTGAVCTGCGATK